MADHDATFRKVDSYRLKYICAIASVNPRGIREEDVGWLTVKRWLNSVADPDLYFFRCQAWSIRSDRS
jgi:hypothetical protein